MEMEISSFLIFAILLSPNCFGSLGHPKRAGTLFWLPALMGMPHDSSLDIIFVAISGNYSISLLIRASAKMVQQRHSKTQ